MSERICSTESRASSRKVSEGITRTGKGALSVKDKACPLFKKLPKSLQVWNSHGDRLTKLPAVLKTVASTHNSPNSAVENRSQRMHGLQFHPEVQHSEDGNRVLENFVVGIAGCDTDWNPGNLAERKVAAVGLALLLPGFVLVGLAASVGMLYGGLAFMAVVSALAMPCSSALVSRYPPADFQGLVLGAFRSVGSLSRAIGPVLGGLLYWSLGSQAPYLAGAVVLLVPLALSLGLRLRLGLLGPHGLRLSLELLVDRQALEVFGECRAQLLAGTRASLERFRGDPLGILEQGHQQVLGPDRAVEEAADDLHQQLHCLLPARRERKLLRRLLGRPHARDGIDGSGGPGGVATGHPAQRLKD